jgi:hypothetical protein
MLDDRTWRDAYGLHTDAIILHCPGPLRRPGGAMEAAWEKAQRAFFTDPATNGMCSDVPDLTIITYNTHPARSLLEDCARRLGVRELVVLGEGAPKWKLEYKITLTSRYLADHPAAEYVMCLDAADVLMLGCPQTALERFQIADTQILFSSTAWDWPRSKECWGFEDRVAADAEPAHRHVNTGGLIGRTEYVRECLTEIETALKSGATWGLTRQGFDDQLAWRVLHTRRHPMIKVDMHCKVFVRFDQHR